MGVTSFIKKQFIDVIHWNEDLDGVLAYRFPMQDAEIQNGAQLTVRDSQTAIFLDEGKIADVFDAGRYVLNTQTLPVLTNLKHWDKLFESPFKSDVYFFSKRTQLNRKWGTSNPITVRDKDYGVVRLRAFGIYSYHLSDPKLFYKQISGTKAIYTSEELEGHLRNTIVAAVTDYLGESAFAFVDMAANQEGIALAIKAKLESSFNQLGLALDAILIQNLSLPEELQKALDSRIGVNMMGGMQDFTNYQVANSIPLAAKNEGGIAGLGAGVAVGFGVGQQLSNALASSTPSNSGIGSHDEVIATIEKLHLLLAKGALSQQEYDAKKSELLSKLK